MKKTKYLVVICLILILAIGVLFIRDKNNKTFIKDGVMFAVTLNGEVIDYFPERGKYDVTISCGNAKGKWLTDEWKFVVEDISGSVLCNLDFTTTPDSLLTVVEQTAVTNENGHRYSGENPDNYIWFNNEMWRIIGAIPTKIENGNIENIVKIIRKDSIGGITLGNVTWEESNIYSLLNNYYLGKKDATNTDYCLSYTLSLKCDYRANGIDINSHYGKMVEKVYWNTGGIRENQNVHEAFEAESSIRDIHNYVGLMSASDYGYASTTYYDKTITQHYKDRVLLNWMYTQNGEWTLTKSSSNITESFSIYHYGQIATVSSKSDVLAVRPVVYLDPSVYVVSGSGTEANPYQIAM